MGRALCWCPRMAQSVAISSSRPGALWVMPSSWCPVLAQSVVISGSRRSPTGGALWAVPHIGLPHSLHHTQIAQPHRPHHIHLHRIDITSRAQNILFRLDAGNHFSEQSRPCLVRKMHVSKDRVWQYIHFRQNRFPLSTSLDAIQLWQRIC